MKKITLVHLMSVLLVIVTSTQLLSQSLPPTQWHRLRTPHVDIIFKGNISREAQRVANTLEHLYEPVSQSLGVQPDKIALVLRNQAAFPNGFITLGPRRAEFHTFPPQNYNFIGTNDWLSLLAVHEFRHVAQHAQLNQNFNQLAYWIGGDLALGTMMAQNIPLWFFEGDAVGMETAFTQSGRGRIPYFSRLYRANLLERGSFSYAKQVLGSFKDPVPDHYSVGYYLTTHLRRKYGPKVLAEIFQRTTLPRLFTTTVKRTTGSSLLQIHEDTNQALTACWQRQLRGLKLTQAIRLHARINADYTNYYCPQLDKEGNIIVLRAGIGTIAQFVGLDGQQRARKIFTPGYIDQSVGFSVAQNQMIWVETIPDSRWEDRSYGVIQRYDTQAKRFKTLTHKSRYGTAALSPDATKIVALESDEGYHHQLVVLDAENGQVLQRLPNPDNHYYLTPKWSEDGKQIVVVKNVRQRITIALIDVTTGETQDLLPYSTEHLGCPVMKGQYIFYNSAYNGIDNIYAIDLATHRRYQVTSRKYGAYNPIISADSCWLIFNDFTKDGMDVVKMPFDPKQWTPLEQVEDRSVHSCTPLVAQEDNSDVLAHVPHRKYPVKRYHPWQHWLSVHSWLTFNNVAWNTDAPQKPSELLQQIELNILRSKDLLSTTELAIDYLHNSKEKFGEASAKLSYSGWYPVVSLQGTLQRKYQERSEFDQTLGLTIELPLTFVQRQFTHKLSLSTTGALKKKDKHTCYTQDYKGLFSRNSKKSLRDIYHPWAQVLNMEYQHIPYGGNKEWLESHFNINATLYCPGLAKHHSFHLCVGYHHEKWQCNKKNIEYELKKRVPAFYTLESQRYLQRPFIQVHYHLPICYPDWCLGNFLYIKRLRADVGYCLKHTKVAKASENIYGLLPSASNGVYRRLECLEHIATQYEKSIHLALLADVHTVTLFHTFQLKVGVQYRYALEQKRGSWLFIFGSSRVKGYKSSS
jgi:hypothetical protein